MKAQFILGGQVLAANADSPETREVLFYSGASVLRSDDRDRLFHLSFSMDPASIDFSLLNSGRAPFVVDHIEDVPHTLGVVERGWFSDAARAVIRFSHREEMAGLISDIKDGVLANISMGARILEMVKAPSIEKGIQHLMAAKWQPFHLSVVSRGADPGAQFLSDCRMEVPAELLNDISAPTGAASEAENSEAIARVVLAIKARRFRVLGR